MEEAISWLKTYDQPSEKVGTLWELTAKKRLAFIHSSENPAVATVVQQWPRYKDPNGYLLVTLII